MGSERSHRQPFTRSWNLFADLGPPSLFLSNLIRIEICAFSGAKIYPGKGKIYVRVDNRVCPLYKKISSVLFNRRQDTGYKPTMSFMT